MGSTPDAPAPLDTNKLANQQRQENRRAAQQNANFNRLNQRDQFGNRIQFNGRNVTQSLGGIGQETNEGMRGLQQQYFQGAGEMLSNPMDVNREVEDRVYNLGASRLDPRMERSRAALENRLANQGIGIGSEAYKNAMLDYGQQENDAYNSLALQARDQAYRESMGQRQQGLGELQGLAGLGARYGMQTVNPNFASVPQIGIPGIDRIGLEQMGYNQRYQNYQNELANHGAMMGGIGGMAGTALGFALGGPMGAQIGGSLGSTAGRSFA